MEKFTLNEAFDKLYEMALDEQLKENIDELLIEQEEQAQYIDSFNILTEWEHDDRDDDVQQDDGNTQNKTQKNNNKHGDDKKSDPFGQIMDSYDKISAQIDKRAQEYIRRNDTSGASERAEAVYKPQVQFQRVERLSDMKFPQNIIFFIGQILKWIKNNILNFIDKFSNIVRSLLGMEAGRGKFDKKDLQLRFDRAKQIETKYLVTGKDAYDTVSSFEDKLNSNFGNSDTAYRSTPSTKTITLYDVPVSQIKALTEDVSPINIFEGLAADTPAGNTEKVICIDTSKDLFALQQSLDHFYGLFDQAYGSNDEKLFSVDDLEIMLQLFKNTYESIFSGKSDVLEVEGELSYSRGIDANRLRENLLRTRINTDNLKKAYIVTNKQINNISQIIMNKNLMGAAEMGVRFAFLSAATYEIMIKIIETIDIRLKEAKEMEKKLQKMKKAYENLVNVLEQRRAKINSVTGLTMTTIIQRKINELYDGARYMTQTVQLRLSTLALYISELNDTRMIMKNLNAIPETAMRENKGILKNFKKLYA